MADESSLSGYAREFTVSITKGDISRRYQEFKTHILFLFQS